jgi:hypothetical protein
MDFLPRIRSSFRCAKVSKREEIRAKGKGYQPARGRHVSTASLRDSIIIISSSDRFSVRPQQQVQGSRPITAPANTISISNNNNNKQQFPGTQQAWPG